MAVGGRGVAMGGSDVFVGRVIAVGGTGVLVGRVVAVGGCGVPVGSAVFVGGGVFVAPMVAVGDGAVVGVGDATAVGLALATATACGDVVALLTVLSVPPPTALLSTLHTMHTPTIGKHPQAALLAPLAVTNRSRHAVSTVDTNTRTRPRTAMRFSFLL